MKMVLFICNSYFMDRVMQILKDNGIDYFTSWDEAKGKGHGTEPHLGTPAHGSLNAVTMIAFEDEKPLAALTAGIETANRDIRRPYDHIRLFQMPLDRTGLAAFRAGGLRRPPLRPRPARLRRREGARALAARPAAVGGAEPADPGEGGPAGGGAPVLPPEPAEAPQPGHRGDQDPPPHPGLGDLRRADPALQLPPLPGPARLRGPAGDELRRAAQPHDDRRRRLQGLQRLARAPRRERGAAPIGLRPPPDGPRGGRRVPLRRRGVRGAPAEHPQAGRAQGRREAAPGGREGQDRPGGRAGEPDAHGEHRRRQPARRRADRGGARGPRGPRPLHREEHRQELRQALLRRAARVRPARRRPARPHPAPGEEDRPRRDLEPQRGRRPLPEPGAAALGDARPAPARDPARPRARRVRGARAAGRGGPGGLRDRDRDRPHAARAAAPLPLLPEAAQGGRGGAPARRSEATDEAEERAAPGRGAPKARGGSVIAITNGSDEGIRDLLSPATDYLLTLPTAPRLLTPVVFTLPLQLLAYHIAVRRGADVDQPRNLAKSVTVE